MGRIAAVAVVALVSLTAAGSAEASTTTITYHADGTANDVSGSHDGTWSGTDLYAAGFSGAVGDLSFAFTGDPSSYITTDVAVGTFGTDDATITFYLRTTSKAHQQLMGARRFCDNPPEGWWEIGMRAAQEPQPGHLTAEFGGQASGATTYTAAISTKPVNDGQWHYVVIRRDSSGVSLSIDGSGAFAAGPPAAINPVVPFAIDHSPCLSNTNVQAVSGDIDELNVTRGPLPAQTNPDSVFFQPRPDHTASPAHTVTFENTGADNITINSVALTGANPTSFLMSGDTCSGHTVAAGGSCSAVVRFRPLGTGRKTAALTFTDSAPGSPQTVPLSGTGTPGAWLSVSKQALKFGHWAVGTTSTPQSLTLTNVGSAPMTVNNLSITGTNAGDFVGLATNCGSLAPGDSCTASLSFKPAATGARTAGLVISSSAPHNPVTVSLQGTGT